MSVLILDAETKSALAATRSLGEKKIEVMAGATRATAMGRYSRYVTKSFQYPSPTTKADDFIAEIIAFGKQQNTRPILYSFSDATFLLISRNRHVLAEYYTLILPSEKSVEIAFSKASTYQLAREIGVPTIPEISEEMVSKYPVVVKPVHSVSWSGEAPQHTTAMFVFDQTELFKVTGACLKETGERPLIQELIVGEEFGVEVMCEGGQVRQIFAHKRVRSISPRGGAAAVKKTAGSSEVVNTMKDYAAALVQKLSWTGPIMVEFKYDQETKKTFLMEINGRFWGSLPLAQYAGIDFAYDYYALATNEKTDNSMDSRYVTTQHFLADGKWLLRVFFARDPLRTAWYPSRVKALYSWVFSTLFDKGDVWSWSDPKPFFVEYIDVIKRSV